jgi:ubiquinone/menaquinone biosynthesis C-methylase UbiE
MDFASLPAAREMYSRAAWTIGFAIVVYINSRADYPGPALQVLIVLALIGVGFVAAGYGVSWLASTGQLRIREQVLDALALEGGERVLEFGTGEGLLGIAAAKRLKAGRVVAIGDTATNDAARENAKTAGVTDKIRFEAGDAKKLAYPDANFDVVLSSRALKGIDSLNAIKEMARILKPGGRLAIHEISDTATYERALTENKLSAVAVVPTTLPLGLGGRILTARK